MSYSNYRYDENDRKLEETSKRLPENFDDIMKGHKQEMIQLYTFTPTTTNYTKRKR